VIIPSIDIADGRVVQLVGGRDQALEAGAPLPWLERFRMVGEVAVVDLDAAMGVGSNRDQIAALCQHASCRVGGGIRSYADAAWWLDRGATQIVIGTAAEPALLQRLPADRVVVALDALHDEVVVEGWRTATGRSVATRMAELEPLVGGFLVTFVEREGRLGGTDLERAAALRKLTSRSLTIAGGITTAPEVAALDALGIDAQVGMAIYTGALDLGDAVAAALTTDREDGLFPTVVADEHGQALGLAWSSAQSLRLAIAERRGIYHSRSRGLWVKGERSGCTQELLAVSLDCDRDALRFTVRQAGTGFCHTGTSTCWGAGSPLSALERTIGERIALPNAESYTTRLLREPDLLAAKVVEEAGELARATGHDEVVEEMADLFYFAMVRLASVNATRADVERVLERRARRITRRAGDAKVAT
jgi:phosphoribosyl-ATP pyrophosphohydrolase/phosphoribosyl-AMP cyclohydrolase